MSSIFHMFSRLMDMMDIVGRLLANRLARMDPADAATVRQEFSFDGTSQGLERDFEILKRCRELSRKRIGRV